MHSREKPKGKQNKQQMTPRNLERNNRHYVSNVQTTGCTMLNPSTLLEQLGH